MGEFKSFDEFQRELHGLPKKEEPAVRFPEEPSESEYQPESEYEEHKTKHHRRRRESRLRPSRPSGLSWKKLFYGTVGVLIIVVLVFLFCPVPLGDITVQGINAVTKNDVLFEGQIKQPVNVLQISAGKLEERLTQDIRISSVKVWREFPFDIKVAINDRVPCAVVQGDYDYAVLDKDGVVMKTETSLKDTDLPIITGKKLGNILLGDRITDPSVLKGIKFFSSLSPAGFRLFSEINVGQANNLIAYTRDGLALRLGTGKDIVKQAKLSQNMVGDVKARNLAVEYIDVNPSAPFIKLKK